MKTNFDHTINRRNTNCYKWDGNKEIFGREDLLPFWVADMDFPCAEPISEALRQRITHPLYGYTFRSDSYFKSITDWLKNRHGWEVDREWLLFCSPGVIQAINIMVNCFSNPGNEIILHLPAYKPLINVIVKNNRQFIKSPLILKNGVYTMDFDDLLAKANPQTQLLLLCNPHNPTGRVWTRDELNRLGDICLSNDITVISDEIHADLVFKDYVHIPFGSLSNDFAMNSITCISASKTFNISGLQLATLIIPNPKLRAIVSEGLDTAQVSLGNVFGEVALEAGYRYCEDWLTQVIEYIEENLLYLITFLKDQIPEITVIKPQGTFLVWLDFRQFEMSSKEINKRLIDQARVALYDGSQFGEEKDGFFRLNLACPNSMLKEGLERMARVLKESR